MCGMEEALEVPILNDLTMVLGSISQVLVLIIPCSFYLHDRWFVFRFSIHSKILIYFLFFPNEQSKATGVVVDFTNPSTVYDNVKQVDSLNSFASSNLVCVERIKFIMLINA